MQFLHKSSFLTWIVTEQGGFCQTRQTEHGRVLWFVIPQREGSSQTLVLALFYPIPAHPGLELPGLRHCCTLVVEGTMDPAPDLCAKCWPRAVRGNEKAATVRRMSQGTQII